MQQQKNFGSILKYQEQLDRYIRLFRDASTAHFLPGRTSRPYYSRLPVNYASWRLDREMRGIVTPKYTEMILKAELPEQPSPPSKPRPWKHGISLGLSRRARHKYHRRADYRLQMKQWRSEMKKWKKYREIQEELSSLRKYLLQKYPQRQYEAYISELIPPKMLLAVPIARLHAIPDLKSEKRPEHFIF